ncbi:hypothetical protein LSCM1_05492 [Leishmania martiniquensis]|uniref:Uncharacterized protein n=1 Tax=Leishmania martiniquensis TaxID=1580590 RepID=A0A836KSU0_9TRYP|nr:hypothetical protein LSCM1_05492 [Leishmania martiniquensis]
MNIFQRSRVDFRQGSSLADDTATLSVVRQPPPAPAPGGFGARAPLPSEPGVRTASKQSTDLSALLAAAQQTHPAAAKAAQRVFPSVPYYGILSRCEVHIDVPIEHGTPSTSSTLAEAGAYAKALLRKPSTTMTQMANIQRRLHDVAKRFGTVYHLSTCTTLSASLVAHLSPNSVGTSSASPFHSQLTYGAYVEALQGVFRRLSALRQTCVSVAEAASGAVTAPIDDSAVTHHTFYLRLLRHPSWKDLSAVLCVEKTRLLLCLICSSRVTQTYLTAACAVAGVALDWIGGATLVAEPLRLCPGDVDPVWAAWDALVHLPLLSPFSAEGGGNMDMHTSATANAADVIESASVGTRDAVNSVRQAGTVLSGFSVSLIASIPFPGATSCHQFGRIAEEAPVLAQQDHDWSASPAPTAAVACSASLPAAAAQRAMSQAVVARRYVWRLVPPPPPSYPATVPTPSSAAPLTLSCCAVLPFFISKLLACLVEECGLTTFTVRCGGPAEATTHLGASSGSAASSTSGAVGVRLVHSHAPSLLTMQQGPSSSSCLAFSRLSSAVWVDAETRESLSLGCPTAVGESAEWGAAEGAEIEFEVLSIRYERPDTWTEAEAERRSWRRTAAGVAISHRPSRRSVKRARACAASVAEDDDNKDGSGGGDAFVQPARWGSSFEFTVAVKRLISCEDFEG